MEQSGRRGRGARGGRSRDEGTARLVGAGPSVVGTSGAMRARDVSRPTADDDAAAEALVVVSYRPRLTPPRAEPPA